MNAIRVAVTRAAPLTAVQFRAAGTKAPVTKAPVNAKKAAPVKKAVTKAVAAKAPVTAKKAAPVKEAVAKTVSVKVAAKEKVAPKEKKLSASPYALFVKKVATGKGKVDYKALSAQWKGLSDAEKNVFREEAKKNAAVNAANKPQKALRQPTKYTAFVKEHFAAAYAAAVEKATDKKEAFRLAVREVAAQYKAQK